VLLVHHDEEGTFGLVLNRPTEILAADLCRSLGISWQGAAEAVVHWGGPVQPSSGWVLCGDAVLEGVDEAKFITEGLHWAGSLEALHRVAEAPPPRCRLFLGYTGWGPGQLEDELARGAWVVAPLAPEVAFEVAFASMWEHVWGTLGINPATVVSTPGVH
jgi:putative transcriptional regulator